MRSLLAGLSLLLSVPALAAEDGSFNADGVKVCYTIEGQGEPVILVHGFCANCNMQWKAPGIMKELAKHYRVIALDNRGHGKSDKPHDPAKYGTEMVEDVVRLMNHLKIKQAHVVGYSMGAFITGKLLTMHPERVKSATIGGAGWFAEGSPTNLEGLADSLEKDKSIGPLIEFLTPEGQPKPSAEQIKQINQLLLSFNDPLALAAVARGMKQLAIPEEKLKGNSVPTLVLCGDLDPLKSGVEPLKATKPNVEVHWLKGANHMDAFARPEFAQQLLKFLQAVDAKELKKAG